MSTGAWLALLRPHQWSKNLLLAVPAVLAHELGTPAVGALALALVATCLVASAGYAWNDTLDAATDRRHPWKSRRPVASGEIPTRWALVAAFALAAAGLALAFSTLPRGFGSLLLVYLATSVAYSWILKRVAVLDVMVLAALYALRVLAGAAAVAVEASTWLLAFSTFFFLSLALVKRCSELTASVAEERPPERGRPYSSRDLSVLSALGIAAGQVSVLVLALYVHDARTDLYTRPGLLWLVPPLLLFWISREWLLVHRGRLRGDPIVATLVDPVSWLVGGGILASIGAAAWPSGP